MTRKARDCYNKIIDTKKGITSEDKDRYNKIIDEELKEKGKKSITGKKYVPPGTPVNELMIEILANPYSDEKANQIVSGGTARQLVNADAKNIANMIINNSNAPEDLEAILKEESKLVEVRDKLATKQGRRLREAIERRKKMAAMFCNVTVEQVLGATAMRAFADVSDAFDENGQFNFKKACETGAIHLIKKFEQRADGSWKVEFYSQESAQDKLGNYLGLEKAPVQSNDESSLKQGIELIALKLAQAEGSEEVTGEHRLKALEKVVNWAKESKARYSENTIEKVVKEISGAKEETTWIED